MQAKVIYNFRDKGIEKDFYSYDIFRHLTDAQNLLFKSAIYNEENSAITVTKEEIDLLKNHMKSFTRLYINKYEGDSMIDNDGTRRYIMSYMFPNNFEVYLSSTVNIKYNKINMIIDVVEKSDEFGRPIASLDLSPPTGTRAIDSVPVTFTAPDMLGRVFADPYRKPSHNQICAFLESNQVRVICSQKAFVDGLHLSYIRKPIDINLINDCELPDIFHQRVVDMAIQTLSQ